VVSVCWCSRHRRLPIPPRWLVSSDAAHPAESDVEDIILAMIEAGWHKSLAGRILEVVGPPIERLTVDRKVKLCASL